MPRYPSHIPTKSPLPPQWYANFYASECPRMREATPHDYFHDQDTLPQPSRDHSIYSNRERPPDRPLGVSEIANNRQKLVRIIERFVRCRFPDPHGLSTSHSNSDSHYCKSDMRVFMENTLYGAGVFRESLATRAIVYTTLMLLQRVRDRMSSTSSQKSTIPYPKSMRAHGDHHIFRKELFVSALTIAHKYHCDRSWGPNDWSIFTDRVFSKREIVLMIRQMSSYLDYRFYCCNVCFDLFQGGLQVNFSMPLPPSHTIDHNWAAYAPGKVIRQRDPSGKQRWMLEIRQGPNGEFAVLRENGVLSYWRRPRGYVPKQ